MESDLQHLHLHLLDHQHNQQKRMNSGLTRYQSAPSSYFSSFFNRESIEDFLHRPTSPETERILDRFLSTSGGDSVKNDSSNVSAPKLVTKIDPQTQTMSQIGQQETSHTSVSPKFYQSQSQLRLPPNPRTGRSLGVDRLPPMKAGGENSNLIRHQSSPAGLFANMEIDIKNFLMRGVDYGTNARSNTEAAFHSSNRPPTSGQMNNPISEIRNKNMPPESPENVDNFSAGFPISPWDDTTMSGNISGVKRLKDEDRTLSGPDVRDVQNADAGNRPPLLVHHLSLPKTSSDMSALEKLLLFQDSVPCKIRAKRGFATHPRSIAERVRRTKISERMRKLQDLVPNMDKQTSTADMLDLAVEYIKDLQNQVKMLSDGCARCRCGYQQQQQ